jgi:spermidine synthase
VHPDPRSILVIGHGTGGTPYASGVNPTTERIRVIEIVGPVFSLMRRFAQNTSGTIVDKLFSDPRIERTVADARHVLFTDPRRYDVIQADAIYPWSSHGGLLYSVSVFGKCANGCARVVSVSSGPRPSAPSPASWPCFRTWSGSTTCS